MNVIYLSRDDKAFPDGIEVVVDDLALEDLDEFAAIRLPRQGEVRVRFADHVLVVQVVGTELD